MNKEVKESVYQKHKDVSSKTIFHDPVLCSQFLRDYVDLPILKNIQPEDIEDVSERYRTFMGVEFEADTVKKIRCREHTSEDAAIYIVSLIEHKSRVDYDVALQLLKYILGIWIDYRNEQNKIKEGISSRKGFRYPPIIPIVYYEGTAGWTADLKMSDRVFMKELFGTYIPDFSYKVVSVHDYSNEELISRQDEMSFIMMLNKIQTAEDFSAFAKLSKEQVEKVQNIISKAPEGIVRIIGEITYNLCRRLNLSEEETRQYVRNVEERDMGYLFENMEKIDIQAERKAAAEARRQTEEARRQTEEAKRRTEEAKERGIQFFIEGYREVSMTKEITLQKLVDKFKLTEAEAVEKIEKYWKE